MTRLDPTKVSLDQPLTDEFATVASGREHWNAVLSDDDQKQWQSLYDVLCQQFVRLRQPLSPAWKARFADVWPQPAGGLLLVERVRECIQDGEESGLAAAADDMESIAREYDLNSTPFRAELDELRRAIVSGEGPVPRQLADGPFELRRFSYQRPRAQRHARRTGQEVRPRAVRRS